MAAPLVIAACVTAATAFADPGPPGGLYVIGYRLEMPHLERYAMPRSETVCLRPGAPIPVLSGNGAFETCAVDALARDGTTFRYVLICPGPAGARAEAQYTLTSEGFTGQIAVKLGAKNMTLTEVQAGRRLGDCNPAWP